MTDNEKLVMRVLRHPDVKQSLAVTGRQGLANYATLSPEDTEEALASLMEKGLVDTRRNRKSTAVMWYATEGKLTVSELMEGA